MNNTTKWNRTPTPILGSGRPLNDGRLSKDKGRRHDRMVREMSKKPLVRQSSDFLPPIRKQQAPRDRSVVVRHDDRVAAPNVHQWTPEQIETIKARMEAGLITA